MYETLTQEEKDQWMHMVGALVNSRVATTMGDRNREFAKYMSLTTEERDQWSSDLKSSEST